MKNLESRFQTVTQNTVSQTTSDWVVAHLIVESIDTSSQSIKAHYATDTSKVVYVTIKQSMRAQANTHRKFRGNLIDEYMAEAIKPGDHILTEGTTNAGEGRLYVRWVNHIQYPKKLLKGIITSSGPKHPDRIDTPPISYQVWTPTAKLVEDLNGLKTFCEFVDNLRQKWIENEHLSRNDKSGAKHYPLGWAGVRFRAVDDHGVIHALSPVVHGARDEDLGKFAPPDGALIRAVYMRFDDMVKKQLGDLKIEAMTFKEHYCSKHIKPNLFFGQVMRDGCASYGLKNEQGDLLYDTERGRYMAAERGFIVLTQPTGSNIINPNEGFVDDFYGYKIKPVILAVKLSDGRQPKMQRSLLPGFVESGHTMFWLEQVQKRPEFYVSDVIKHVRENPYQDLPVKEEMMQSQQQKDSAKAYKIYEATNKSLRMGADDESLAELKRLEHHIASGDTAMLIYRYYKWVDDKLIRHGTLSDYEKQLRVLWKQYADENNIPYLDEKGIPPQSAGQEPSYEETEEHPQQSANNNEVNVEYDESDMSYYEDMYAMQQSSNRYMDSEYEEYVRDYDGSGQGIQGRMANSPAPQYREKDKQALFRPG